MSLNFLSPTQTKLITFSDTSKSQNHLLNLQGGFCFKRKDVKVAIGKGIRCSAQPAPPPAWPGTALVDPGVKNWDGPKPISIVGSTGSIGTQTLDIVAENPDKFRVVALAAGSNVTLLAEQVIMVNESLVNELKEALADADYMPEIIPGEQGVIEVARHPDCVTVVTGIVGCAGLTPTVAAIEAGKNIALANKETLIAGGPFVLPLARKHNVKILPADSEHSAIFQDSSVLAQLGWPDMRLPILYTLLGSLTFKAPDNVKYPSMDLSYSAGRAGGTMTGVLSAANEKAVEMFIDEKIKYLDIFKVVELTCEKHQSELVTAPSLEEIIHYDLWAREYAASVKPSSTTGLTPAIAL
ncbi:hypothetical protein Ccrd_022851 [Cynara cardunculus var. scolymus]|uniref:1-deoxy-D-xylulose-5-phosphate reductoisomerase n=1 Tax=Cynara cardunculus var. scolymus TaxID=59895 RepID=A0A103XY26_CYNCS|nr:hypothetical protein Ccrd_022851 [Cynara cardunculus var. scolymus]